MIHFTIAMSAVSVMLAAPQQAQEGADYGVFEVSDLRCVIGNNKALGEHRAWYNGIFEMTAPGIDENVYVPLYAGFNLENFFDARPRHPDGAVFFEPRAAAMEFRRINETTAELYQPPTPYFGVESWTRFELKAPYYVDVTFRCIPRKANLPGGFLGIFWASYINAPENKSIYFLSAGSTLDKPHWTQYCTQHHDHYSTVRSEQDTVDLFFEPGPTVLWNQISPLKYALPLYYGHFRDRALIYMFQPDPNIRISHSPSGGGPTAKGDADNPAWDFQYIMPDYEVDKEYGWKARIVYKKWVDREDVLAEARKFLSP